MDISIKEESKHKLVLDIKGEGHTLCNVLADECWNDSNVDYVGYVMKHPLVSTPEFIISTKGKDPKKVLEAALGRLKKTNDGFLKAFAKA